MLTEPGRRQLLPTIHLETANAEFYKTDANGKGIYEDKAIDDAVYRIYRVDDDGSAVPVWFRYDEKNKVYICEILPRLRGGVFLLIFDKISP
ncbi:MAG: hypothetical protein IJ666_03890 [Ruminococcus sp.]|nr:hypothetical protein [Ruminococcus sp.]